MNVDSQMCIRVVLAVKSMLEVALDEGVFSLLSIGMPQHGWEREIQERVFPKAAESSTLGLRVATVSPMTRAR